MVKGTFTCSLYIGKIREVVTVKGKDFDDIWEKAKKKVARKYKVKTSDIDITSSYWEEIKE
jgi:hypothetical protein